MSIEANINLAILETIAAASLSSVAYPNVEHNGVKPYYRVHLLPSKTEPYSLVSSNIYQGIVQIDVVAKEGTGLPVVDALVATALAIFPRSKLLIKDGFKIRFDAAGWASPAIHDGVDYFVPVNFMYLSISKES